MVIPVAGTCDCAQMMSVIWAASCGCSPSALTTMWQVLPSIKTTQSSNPLALTRLSILLSCSIAAATSSVLASAYCLMASVAFASFIMSLIKSSASSRAVSRLALACAK